MHYNTAIIAFAACASAVQIQSKLQAEDIVDNFIELGENIYEFGEVAIEGFENLGEDIADFGEDAFYFSANFLGNMGKSTVALGDYLISSDGLIEDIELTFTDEVGAKFEDFGEDIISGDLFVEGYNWMSDGSNWESLGKGALEAT